MFPRDAMIDRRLECVVLRLRPIVLQSTVSGGEYAVAAPDVGTTVLCPEIHIRVFPEIGIVRRSSQSL